MLCLNSVERGMRNAPVSQYAWGCNVQGVHKGPMVHFLGLDMPHQGNPADFSLVLRCNQLFKGPPTHLTDFQALAVTIAMSWCVKSLSCPLSTAPGRRAPGRIAFQPLGRKHTYLCTTNRAPSLPSRPQRGPRNYNGISIPPI